MDKILLDTDVILDFYADRQPHATQSAIILSWSDKQKVKIYTTPVIISNVYYLLKRLTKAKHEFIVDKLSDFLMNIEILSIDKHVILQSLKSSFSDFEDALQNYAGENNASIDIVITRNTKDYKHSNLAIMTPHEYIYSRMSQPQ